MNAHSGLSEAQAQRLDAALMLLLANHVADPRLLRGFLDEARAAVLQPERA